ncbi:MAG: sodium:alanine symporter family protein [Clostridia bacterium]|nr:sodium:alanine symporter family protein [Clostridia bacterium]
MEAVLEVIAQINSAINGVVWGWPMIILILGTGIYLTVRTRVLQVRKFGTSWGETIVPTVKSIGKKQKTLGGENTISPFEAFATAISGTVGTGNIIGVTSAIMSGGPGAVFWMWVSAFFGMVTNYAENVLGMYFRKKGADGEFSGGPMQYLSEGIGRNTQGKWGAFLKTFGKILGVMAAVFCTFAAIGMSGAQTNNIAGTFEDIFRGVPGVDTNIVVLIVGIVIAVVLALVILGGIKSIGRVASVLVPFMSLVFILMALIIIFANVTMIGNAFALIFGNIFSFESALSGVGGYAFAQVIQKGLARGIFSNEAGLGSSVIAHSASATREPVKQGFWGIFEVFFDTFIICTLTALVVLVSFGNDAGMQNVLYAENQLSTTVVSMRAFQSLFGDVGTVIYAIIIPLFAFTTILAWSYYGEKCVAFLFRKTGEKGQKIATVVFKVAYVLLVIVAAVMDNTLAWEISDTFNGLMALPNLVGLVIMGGLVAKITKNYFDRKKGLNVEPMLSAYPEQNERFKADLEMENAAEQESAETAEK